MRMLAGLDGCPPGDGSPAGGGSVAGECAEGSELFESVVNAVAIEVAGEEPHDLGFAQLQGA
jgi:hypothetical protein